MTIAPRLSSSPLSARKGSNAGDILDSVLKVIYLRFRLGRVGMALTADFDLRE
jgi:hypothetical protein